MLSILLSHSMQAREKKDILYKKFGISLEREGVDEMCNLSDILLEQGIEQGIEQGKKKGTLDSILNLMKNLHFSMEDAMKALSIPEDQWNDYRSMLSNK